MNLLFLSKSLQLNESEKEGSSLGPPRRAHGVTRSSLARARVAAQGNLDQSRLASEVTRTSTVYLGEKSFFFFLDAPLQAHPGERPGSSQQGCWQAQTPLLKAGCETRGGGAAGFSGGLCARHACCGHVCPLSLPEPRAAAFAPHGTAARAREGGFSDARGHPG